MDGIELLYHNYEVLSEAGDKIAEHEKEYLEIINAVKGSNNEKKLASQFISKFYENFPEKTEQAIEAQLDLCEDDDLPIRKQAIRNLPNLCKNKKENIPKIADVLTQLLQTDDNQELIVVNSSLLTLFQLDPKGTLGGLFSQILNAEDVIRERAIKFLSSKIKVLPKDIFTNELEEFILEKIKNVLQDVTGEEFVTLMGVLSSLKFSRTLNGQQTLLQVVIELAELDKGFEPAEPDCVDKLVQCVKQAMPFFSIYAPSTPFLKYIVMQVLPTTSDIEKQDSESNSEGMSMELLHLLAEMAPHCGKFEEEECISKVFEKLLELMPQPPSEENQENDMNGESKFDFSSVECLMYTLHQLAKKQPEFLDLEKNNDRMKDFKLRLQYFARHAQGYVKELREAIKNKKDDMKSEDNKLTTIALKTTSNINTLIRDLFHNPPSFKSSIALSWTTPSTERRLSAQSNDGAANPNKRSNKTPITFDDTPAKKLIRGQNREIYSPPSGKYSDKVSKFQGKRGRGGGGFTRGGRSNWRGRY